MCHLHCVQNYWNINTRTCTQQNTTPCCPLSTSLASCCRLYTPPPPPTPLPPSEPVPRPGELIPVTFNSSSRLVNDCGLLEKSGSTVGSDGPPSMLEREETKRVLVSGVCKLSEEREVDVFRRVEGRERGAPWEEVELPPPVAIYLSGGLVEIKWYIKFELRVNPCNYLYLQPDNEHAWKPLKHYIPQQCNMTI